MSHILTAKDITDTTVKMVLTLDGSFASDTQVTFAAIIQGTTPPTGITGTATIPAGSVAGDTVEKVLTGLTPATTYGGRADIDGEIPPVPMIPTSFTTKPATYSEPKTATWGQWEDLASRVKAPVGTAKIENNAVTTDKIQDEAVTSGKIDWNTVGTGFAEDGATTSYFRRTKWVTIWDYYKAGTPATATVSGTYTSPSGNPYGFIVVNHRTGGAITSGAENITHARGGFFYQPTTNRAVEIAVRGIGSSSNTYFDCTGGYDIASNSAIAPYRYTAASSGQIYSPAIKIGSSSSQNTISVTWEAVRGTASRWWHIRGTVYGQRVAANFVISANATTEGTVPGIYVVGTGENLPTFAGSWFEIDEPQND